MTPRAYDAAQRLAKDPGATEAERANARARCAEHEAAASPLKPPDKHIAEQYADALRAVHDATTAARKMASTMPLVAQKIPWWLLKISPRSGPRLGRWLGNTREFRTVLRGERDGRLAISSHIYSNYTGSQETLSALDRGMVDWTGLGDAEPWRASTELKARMKTERAGNQ